MISGLGQAAAFYKSKGRDKQGHSTPHLELYLLLSGWLCSPGRPFAGGEDLLLSLAAENQHTYRAAQAEALAFLQWVKKVAKAQGEGANAAP